MGFREGENLVVGAPTRSHVENVLTAHTRLLKGADERPREVLIDEKLHGLLDRAYLLVSESASRIGECGQDIFSGESVFVEDLVHGQSASELPDNEIHWHSGALDNGPAESDALIYDYSWGDLGHALDSTGKYTLTNTVERGSHVHRSSKLERVRTFGYVGIDFFTVPTATFRVLFAFVVLSHDRRRVLHFNVTGSPSADWAALQM